MGKRQSKVRPQPGDRIEIFGGGYQHWALYVGDGYVVHLCQTNSWRFPFRVVKERLSKVAKDYKWRVNNDLDEEYKPRAVKDIVKNGLKQVGDEGIYSIIKNNCEHFVNKLRYGEAVSQKAQAAAAVIEIATKFNPLVGSALGVGANLLSSISS